jgi:predicted component of type VI protein secretion system
MQDKTIGRSADCDLVIGHESLAALHARAELNPEGYILVSAEGPQCGLYLQRSDTWIRVQRVKLCVGDSVRLGACEIGLPRLSGLFDPAAGARLHPRPSAPPKQPAGLTRPQPPKTAETTPRRNPDTGKIEE